MFNILYARSIAVKVLQNPCAAGSEERDIIANAIEHDIVKTIQRIKDAGITR
ncbi:MAG: hypothetical protein GWP18_06605 [Proteobacteria bacterium]|nr:hypothetical protein [Pseudomonadota bacterium]